MTPRMIKVHFSCQENDKSLDLDLPSDIRFEDLTPLMIKNDFVLPQKPGYYYIIKDHLCGTRSCLCDYVPDWEDSVDVTVFGIPLIMD